MHRHGGAGRLPPEEGAAADLLRARADELDSSPCQHPYAADSVWMPFVLHGAPLLAPQAAHDTAMPMPFG